MLNYDPERRAGSDKLLEVTENSADFSKPVSEI